MPAPKGFLFSTAGAGIKRPGRDDLALIVSEVPAVVAGTFTTNRVKAAPVRICMAHARQERGQAILANSGNANACTGRRGMKDAEQIIGNLARLLGLKPPAVYPCSTGVIGVPLPVDRIVASLGSLAEGLGNSSVESVARAIMTTDTFPKLASSTVRIDGKSGVVTGVCKGAGMIAPNMATMLCFIITDIAVDQQAVGPLLRDAVSGSFNRISVDGDMSTNDTVLLFANGALGNRCLTPRSKGYRAFKDALTCVTMDLARLIVKDGEGASKVVTVAVTGAPTTSDAEKAAFAVANSLLVKTALYGNDPNWGRVMAALGRSGARMREERVAVSLNGITVVENGLSCRKEEKAAQALRKPEVEIRIDLHSGTASAQVLTCDLTERYIQINAEYTT